MFIIKVKELNYAYGIITCLVWNEDYDMILGDQKDATRFFYKEDAEIMLDKFNINKDYKVIKVKK